MELNSNTNPPIFPKELKFDSTGYCANSKAELSGGVTLLDYIAAQVLTSLILSKVQSGNETPATDQEYARGAYRAAYAMLQERREWID